MQGENINALIESILDRRQGRGAYAGKGRLQEIETRINALSDVLVRIKAFDNLVKEINSQIISESGSYFNMLSKDPEAMVQFKTINCETAIDEVSKTLEELQNLKRRFERPALRIAFVGRERQGKSTFLKTISGLNDKIIPAYSGNSCTGAVSVIHNCPNPKLKDGIPVKVLVRVQYYDEGEMLGIVNSKLKKFFPSGIYHIGKLDQISSLSLPELPQITNDAQLCTEYTKFKETTVDHYSIYAPLIGRGVVEYCDEDEIAQHVAQYEEFDHEEPNTTREERGDKVYWIRKYYKYLAVKSVDIYTSFSIEATEKLELVDTIGIGGSSDSKIIEDEMYRVLREDCDGAIDLFRPEMTGAVPKEQTNILNKISDELSSRNPSNWIGYVINRVLSGEFINSAGGAESAHRFLNKSYGNNPDKPVAWIKLIDGDNFDDVKDNLVRPLLELISSNLDTLDQQLTDKVNKMSLLAYNACLSLVKASRSVISADISCNAGSLALFDEKLYTKLLSDFGKAMNILDIEGYAKLQNEPCAELATKYEEVIGSIGGLVPKTDKLYERFITGMGLTEVSAFEEAIEQMRNDIFSSFEDVNTTVLYPLQEKVKLDIIKVLYEDGLMKNLPVPVKEPSSKWLQAVIDNYVDEQTYPNLRKALEFILDYKLNIEGMVEFNVAKSLDIIDRTHKDFIQYQGEYSSDFKERAQNVWQELRSRRPKIAERLKNWIYSFSTIPNHSFYSRVHKFHLKVLSDEKGRGELRRFYRNNMSLIWTDEIVNAGITQKAFGEWNERSKALQQCVNTTNFNIS